MYSLNPIPLLYFQKWEWRKLTPQVVDDAVATAARVLRDGRRGTRLLLQDQAVSLLLGGAMPLLTNLLFGWPAYLVMLGIAADNTVLWLSDALKALFAREELLEQWEGQCQATDAISVAHTVAAHPRPTDSAGIPVYRALVRSRNLLDGAQTSLFIALLPLSWGSMFYPDAKAENARMETFIILAIPVAIRMLIGFWAIVRQRSKGRTPSLLPQAPRQLLAFLCAALIYVFGSLLVEDVHNGSGRYDGIAFFSIYFLCMAISAIFVLRSVLRAEAELGKLGSTDLAALKQRLSQSH